MMSWMLSQLIRTPTDKGKRLQEFLCDSSSNQTANLVIFVNEEELMHFSYLRFLENQIRKAFVFEGTPDSLNCKGSGG